MINNEKPLSVVMLIVDRSSVFNSSFGIFFETFPQLCMSAVGVFKTGYLIHAVDRVDDGFVLLFRFVHGEHSITKRREP